MRRLFLSATALVLGLFTVTALFAFNLSKVNAAKQDITYEFQLGTLNPEEDWKNPSNWVPEPNPACSSGIHPCSITLPEDESLADYLQGLIDANVSYHELVDQDEIEPRANP